MANTSDAMMQYLQSLPPAERQAAMAQMMGQEPKMQGSPQDIASIMGIGEVNDQITDADSAMARAQALRNTAGPEGRSAAGVYTAANPLEHLASLGKQAAGIYQEGKAQDKLDALRKDRTGLRTKKWLAQYGDNPAPSPLTAPSPLDDPNEPI